MLWRKLTNAIVEKTLRLGKNAVIQITNANGTVSTVSLAEQAVLDGVTAGTVTASKAVVVDSSKNVTGFATVTTEAIVGGDSSLGITGQATAQGGAVAVVGGVSSTAGNPGGAVSITGGAPGATGVGGAASVVAAAGGATSGKGGAANVTAGAGTAGNASGGSVVITAGAKHSSGLDGGIFNRASYLFQKQTAPVAKTDGAATLTAAEMISGIVVHTVSTGRTLTTPTGAEISAGCPTDLAVGDSFDVSVITVGTGADDISTLTAGDGGVTFVGNVTVGPDASTFNGYGTFRFRNTGTGTWIGYRIG